MTDEPCPTKCILWQTWNYANQINLQGRTYYAFTANMVSRCLPAINSVKVRLNFNKQLCQRACPSLGSPYPVTEQDVRDKGPAIRA